MNSERQIEARQYRAQGRELALGIRADAERQTIVIEANAYKRSEELRGDGDARSANVYAAAFNQDPEFYEFYRSINAYANVFSHHGIQISRRDMHEVVSGERDQLMLELKTDLNSVMTDSIGIEVVDVRVKRIDLPTDVSTSVYERMNSERQIEARQYRAQGRELALGIRADAERQTIVIEANAYKQSEELRGDGDASSSEFRDD